MEDEVKIGDDIFIAGFRSGQLLEDNSLRFVSGNIISISKQFLMMDMNCTLMDQPLEE